MKIDFRELAEEALGTDEGKLTGRMKELTELTEEAAEETEDISEGLSQEIMPEELEEEWADESAVSNLEHTLIAPEVQEASAPGGMYQRVDIRI